MVYHIKVMKGGRITIPAALRRELGWEVGDTLVLEDKGDHLVVSKVEQNLT